jgi:hypothetical protein
VQRAQDELSAFAEARRALEVEAEEQVRTLHAEMELNAPDIEEVIVRPSKSDMHVSDLKLAWKRG